MAKKIKSAKFPLKISYETSLLTLITFVISIASLLWQTINYFEGPKVRLIAPDQIVIGSSERVKYPNRDGGPYVHFITPMSYVNAASAGYNATVRAERIRIKIEGQQVFEHQWYHFVHSDAVGEGGTELKVETDSDARPFPLAAGSSASHETLFQPWEKQCAAGATKCHADDYYVDWTTFLDWTAKNHVIEFEFLADIFGSNTPVVATCKVNMSEQRFKDMVARRWASPACVPQG